MINLFNIIHLHYVNKTEKVNLMNTTMICSATIATIFGHSIEIMDTKPHPNEAGVYVVSYTRPDDGKMWVNKCKIKGDKVIWGAIDGRWRTHTMDSKITFSETEDFVTINETFSDGSISTERYLK